MVGHRPIATAIAAFLKWGKSLPRKVLRRVTRYQPTVPRETLRLVPQLHQTWWALGSIADKPAMQTVSHWTATNIIDVPVHIARAYLVRPKTEALMVVVRQQRGNMYGHYAIEPHSTTEVAADFWIVPPVKKEGQDFTGTVVFIDQFGNEHKVKRVVFRGPKPKEPKPEGPSKESIHAIQDPIEKEVVAVLKAEVSRYQQCGRRVGGLAAAPCSAYGVGLSTLLRRSYLARRDYRFPPHRKASAID